MDVHEHDVGSQPSSGLHHLRPVVALPDDDEVIFVGEHV
jgi:hypothetical protein